MRCWCLLLAVVAWWCRPACPLPVRLLVALPQEDAPRLSKGLVRRPEEDMNATRVSVPGDVLELVESVCEALSRLEPHLVVSFLPKDRNFYVAMLTGQAGIPMLSLARQYTDQAAKEMNSLLVSLDPGPASLSDALFRLLCSQEWTSSAAILVDGSGFADAVAHRLGQLAKTPVLRMPHDRSGLVVRLSSLHASDRRVVAVCCSPARPLVREARRLGMVGGHWVWILMEGAATNTDTFPDGMLAIRLKRHTTNRHSVRSALDLVSESARYLDGNLWLSEADPARRPSTSCWYNGTDAPTATGRIADALHT